MGIGKSINLYICSTRDTHNCLTKASHEGRSFKDFPVRLMNSCRNGSSYYLWSHGVFPNLTIL